MQGIRERIAVKIALTILAGFSSGVGQAVTKAVIPEARLDAVKTRLERLLEDPESNETTAPTPTAVDQRQALQDAPLEHLQAVASAQGISYQDVDRDELVELIVASSQRQLHRARGVGQMRKPPVRQPLQPRRKADLRRQQRQMGKRKSR